MFVAIDGELVAPEQATISVFDRGFLYGDSVFDTTRTYAGAAFKLREHVERLARSASKMGFELPRSVEELVVEVQRLIDEVRPRAGGAELVARLMITRGEGPFGLDPTEAVKPRRVLYLHGLSRPTAGAYEDGGRGHLLLDLPAERRRARREGRQLPRERARGPAGEVPGRARGAHLELRRPRRGGHDHQRVRAAWRPSAHAADD
jgi:branched-subunit amino acid aminotransferase/4-amino-4-deoxychorismate lyase